jgi:hypothetical protein
MTEYANVAYAYCNFAQYLEGFTSVMRIFGIEFSEQPQSQSSSPQPANISV